MLDILRQNAKNALTYVLFGIIIVVFVVSFGPGSRGCADSRGTGPGWAAQVNGVAVTASDFDQTYSSLLRNFLSRGQGLTREMAEQLGLRKMALDQLVEQQLLEQEGARLGLVVSDEELEQAIVKNPSFHVDGRFQRDAYLQGVTQAYGTVGRFEEQLRRSLLASKVVALLRTTARVSEDEVHQAFASEGDRANVEFARFPLSAAREAVKPSPDEAKAFQARNADRIEAFYKENAARFDRKKRVQARHILVRVPEKAPAAEDEAARKKAEDALARARKGEDFGALARALSEDPGSKESGGDLGWFSAGVMAKPFEDAAFATAAPGLTGPVRTTFGWHVIQVLQSQEPEVIPLERAASEIATELLGADRAKELANKLAADALSRLRTGKSFAELFPAEAAAGAKARGPGPVRIGSTVVRPDETGSFGAGQRPNLPRLGPQADLFDDALAAGGPQLLAKVYETASGPVVARVKERRRPDEKQYAAQRADVESRLRSQRQAQVESAWMRALREKASVKINEAFVRGPVPAAPVQLD